MATASATDPRTTATVRQFGRATTAPPAAAPASRRVSMTRATSSASPGRLRWAEDAGSRRASETEVRRLSASLPRAGVAQALNRPREVCRRSPQRLSTRSTAPHGTCTVRQTLASVTPSGETVTCGSQKTAHAPAASASGTAPYCVSSAAPPFVVTATRTAALAAHAMTA
ncbi:hypothetical protein [Georgenia sp. SUBG003]|uniref:hypothetical protein n=1 Tax=Georgenia sp. SUBG003 TaxID=1497974 RepID=UPI003AB85FEC